jgi:NAD(P)-dependent dehydrogenase (short-subunit alcohol dehydrogenase family)
MTTWLITGCSTGLGRALAEAVLEHGDNAVVTARDVSTVEALAASYPGRALAVALDVTDAEQIAEAVRVGTDAFGAIDVLVNNAGYGYRAAIEEADDAHIRDLFETHFFGTVNGIKAVLPQMRARRSGTIVNISSIGARLMFAGSGYYAAVKAAIEGITGSLRKEVEPLGITAMVIEPGGFRTDFSGRSLTQSTSTIDDYADTAGKRRKEHDTTHGTQAGDPVKAARAIIAAVEAEDTPELLVLGTDATVLFKEALEAQLESLERWRALGESTAVDS